MRRRAFLMGVGSVLAGLSLPRFCPTSDARAAGEPGGAPGAAPSLLLAVGGDTILGYNLQAHFDAQRAAGMTNERLWPLYFAGVTPVLDAADLALVNLECPFTERGDKLVKKFNFRARPELVEILKAGSVDVVTLANNHQMDYGAAGLDDTLATLDAAGIAHFGAGRNLEHARRPAVLERAGIKAGFLGYYFQSAADMLEPRALFATDAWPGVAGCYTDLACIRDQITEDVRRLVPCVDAAFVYFHWGKEGSIEVVDYQVELAHLCMDLGCKAVFGAHPHRFQGVEVYRERPIFYSLGNFVFGGSKDPRDKLSALARVRVSKAGVVEAELVPIQITRWPEAPFQPFLLRDSAREKALARIAALSETFPQTLPMLQPYLKEKPKRAG
jgi:poly-gamma-glutamate synthesis protein (capsule biosynthesis protein)